MSEMPVHSAAYKRRRFLNWFPLGLTYAAYYMGRYNLNVVSDDLTKVFGLTKAEYGIIATCGFWVYAMAVLFNGPLADRIGGKKAIVIGAFGASVMNFLIGVMFFNGWTAKLLVAMSLLYGINQYFQSFGALSVVKVNSPWFHVKERGIFGGIFGIMISCGYFLAMTVGGWILAYLPLYWVYFIPSAIILIMGLIDHFWVKDTPKAAGFENFDTGDASSQDKDKDKPLPTMELLKRMIGNRVIRTLAASEFCTGFVRQSLMLWFVLFLTQVHHVVKGSALFSIATAGTTVGGILGGILCGWMSDKLFQSRRPPVAFVFYLCQIVAVLILTHTNSAVVASYMIGVCCMFIFGVHGMLTGTAAMDFGGTRGASTAAGILDGVQYLASGITGLFMGKILDIYGWNAWCWMIIPFSVMGAILMTTIWHETPIKKEKKEEPATAK